MKKYGHYLIVFLATCVIFQIKFSFEIIDFRNINWLMLLGSDRTPDFLAWEYFRITPWQFPIGIIEGYSYPNISSVGLTGAIPLFAIPAKIFSHYLPENFQYFGLWFFLCYILQGFFALKIFELLGVKRQLPLILFSIIIVLTPAFLDRTEHMNLCCHWVLLYAIWTYLLPGGMKDKWKHLLAFNGLFALTHPYLIVFGVVMSAAIAMKEWHVKEYSFWKAGMWILISILQIATLWFIVGNFAISSGSGKASGYGIYSTNLNTFFNSLDKAFLFPGLPTFHIGQYEGFAYLGLGIILLFLFNAKKIFALALKKSNRILLWATILLAIFSLSNIISFFGMHATIPLPQFLLDIGATFRSTGRYIWLANYLIFIAVLVSFYRLKLKRAYFLTILISVFVIQVIDCQSLLFLSPFNYEKYEAPLTNEVWEELIEASDKVNVYPPYIRDIHTFGVFIHFAQWGYRFQKPVSFGHLARFDQDQRDEYLKYLDQIRNSTLPNEELNSIFIMSPKYLERFRQLESQNEVKLVSLDGYVLAIPSGNDRFMEILDDFQDKFLAPQFKNLTDLIPDNKGKWVLISLKDEGSRNLCTAFKDQMQNLGSEIGDLAYRGSYMAILFDGKLIYEELDNENLINKSFQKGSRIANIELPFNLSMTSAGNLFGNEVEISVNGKNYEQDKRGLNIAILMEDGSVEESLVVDTFESCLY